MNGIYNGTTTTDSNGYYWVKNVPLQFNQPRSAAVVITPPTGGTFDGVLNATISVLGREPPITAVYLVDDVIY
jgi:hypothetical protein